MSRLRSLFLAALAATAIATAPIPAHAWCRTTTQRADVIGECNSTGTPRAWRSVCVGFSLFPDGSPDVSYEDLLTTATNGAGLWHQALCNTSGATPYFQVLPLPDSTAPSGYDRFGVNANVVSFNSTWELDESHVPGSIAITMVAYDRTTGEIFDADIEVNEQSETNRGGYHFNVGASDPESMDLPTVLAHEFGHVHGLGHSDIPAAVMYRELNRGQQRRTLTPDDVEGICASYDPASAPDDRVCNVTPYGGFAPSRYGGRVRGGCAVGSRTGGEDDPPGGALVSLIGVVVVLVASRRRALAALRSG